MSSEKPIYSLLFTVLLSSCTPAAPVQRPPNSILIEDLGLGKGQPAKRPITIGRVFDQGEFPTCVQASVGGEPLLTQCDVKTRWPDGSLRQAVLSFWTELRAGGYTQVDFTEQPCAASGGGLSKDEMLAFLDGQWGAKLTATARGRDGAESSHTIDARALLAAWNGEPGDLTVRYWLRGPVVTQLIVEDKSPDRRADFGWRPLHPALELPAEFKPGEMKIQVAEKSRPNAAAWPLPAQAYVGTEKVRLCGFDGSAFTVCPNGRGLDGTDASRRHLTSYHGLFLIADQDWEDAAEDKYKSLHPLFVVTIYPGWPGVEVQAILENVWADRIQDQSYHVSISDGGKDSRTVMNRGIVHPALTRWRKRFWNGTALPPLRVDHNFPYLIFTGAVPSYDLDLKFSDNGMANLQRAYAASDRGEPIASSVWDPIMGNAGGRGDIGVLPQWQVAYLYTADATLQDLVFSSAEASASVPMHFREPVFDDRRFDATRPETAFGRVISLNARPTFFSMEQYWSHPSIQPQDRATIVGVKTSGGWVPDVAHQPSMTYLPYILTGDWFLLEEMQFWSAWSIAQAHPGYSLAGTYYLDSDFQSRVDAWFLRSLAQTASISPDNTPEKTYFTKVLMNNIAIREGRYAIQDGAFYAPAPLCPPPCKSSLWRYGRDVVAEGRTNPLLFVANGAASYGEEIDQSKTKLTNAPWMDNFLRAALAHVEDLGYVEMRAVRRALAVNLIWQLQHPDYNPVLATLYRTPVSGANGEYFTTWAQVKDAFTPSSQNLQTPPAEVLCAFCYAYVLRGAAATVTEFSTPDGYSGLEGFRWTQRVAPLEGMAADPTWAFAPRQPREAPATAAFYLKRKPRWLKQTQIASTKPK